MTFFELKYNRVKRIVGISAQMRKKRAAISQATLCFFTETGTLLVIFRIITARIYLSDSCLSIEISSSRLQILDSKCGSPVLLNLRSAIRGRKLRRNSLQGRATCITVFARKLPLVGGNWGWVFADSIIGWQLLWRWGRLTKGTYWNF